MSNINNLPQPLGCLTLHWHPDDTHDPEALSLRHKNQDPRQVRYLIQEMGSMPAGLEDIVLLCFPSRVELMRRRYPHVQVFPLLPATYELGSTEIQGLLGIDDPNDTRLYTRQLRQAMASLPDTPHPSLEELQDRLLSADLSPGARGLVQARIGFLKPNVCDAYPLRRLLRPGRLIILDLRDPYVGKQDALTMATICLSILIRRDEQRDFNLIVRVDEMRDYLSHYSLVSLLEMLPRKRRHLGLITLYATQFPHLISREMVANADLIGVGRMEAPEALRFIAKEKVAFAKLKAPDTEKLPDGELWIWSERTYADPEIVEHLPGLLKVQVRAQNAQHGGATLTSVQEDDDEDLDEEDEDDTEAQGPGDGSPEGEDLPPPDDDEDQYDPDAIAAEFFEEEE